MIQPMPLETERLWLRPVEMTHAPALQVLVSDRLIAATTMNIPHPYPDNGAVDWIQGVLDRRAAGTGDHTFTIIRKDGEVVMGGIGINPGPGGFSAEVGYWIGVPYPTTLPSPRKAKL